MLLLSAEFLPRGHAKFRLFPNPVVTQYTDTSLAKCDFLRLGSAVLCFVSYVFSLGLEGESGTNHGTQFRPNGDVDEQYHRRRDPLDAVLLPEGE